MIVASGPDGAETKLNFDLTRFQPFDLDRGGDRLFSASLYIVNSENGSTAPHTTLSITLPRISGHSFPLRRHCG